MNGNETGENKREKRARKNRNVLLAGKGIGKGNVWLGTETSRSRKGEWTAVEWNREYWPKRGKRWEEKGAGCHGGGWQKWAMAMVGKKEEEEKGGEWDRGRPTVEWRAKRRRKMKGVMRRARREASGGMDGKKKIVRWLAENWWVMA